MAKSNLSSKYAEDWIPVKSIINGMIQLDNGEYVTGVKIEPKNIFILDQGAEDNVIFNLRNFYSSIDYEFWLMVADKPVDISVFLSQLQVLLNNTQVNSTRKLIIQDIEKAKLFMSNQADIVDTEYYLLFKEKRLEIIQKRIQNLISGLASCGMNSQQVSNEDLRGILDNFFNANIRTDFRTVVAE